LLRDIRRDRERKQCESYFLLTGSLTVSRASFAKEQNSSTTIYAAACGGMEIDMKINIGLVSISFRELTVEKIIEYVKDAGLSSIEWGADVHVPFGDAERAKYTARITKAAGLEIPEYGSYYRLGVSPSCDIEKAVTSARALGTNIIRVWAFNKGSEGVTEEEYNRTVEDAKRICLLYPDIVFCTECHNNTLTDDWKINVKLIKSVDMPNFGAFWQPNQLKSFEYNLESVKNLSGYIKSVHVFAWEGNRRLPLAEHRDIWLRYLKELAKNPSINLMLEFMHDDRVESLGQAAKELILLAKCLKKYSEGDDI